MNTPCVRIFVVGYEVQSTYDVNTQFLSSHFVIRV